ncbi:MAG: glycosyltransferase family 4 protein [Myxococcaceae bacterium]
MQSVAFDATLWDEPTTGIGLYTHETVEALRAQAVHVSLLGAAHSGECPRKVRGRTAFALAELPRVLRERPEPIFHAASNFNLPLQRIPGKRFVLTVHDLIPVLRPETVSRAFRWQFELWLSRSLRVADHVICVSEHTRKDLLTRYGFDRARTSVVYNGVDHVQRLPKPDATGMRWLETLALPEEFVLYAGALDARKNVARVIDAIESLHDRGRKTTLVLAGQKWFGSGATERRVHELQGRGLDIRPLGYVEAPLFYALMRRARLFVFPSLYEGFGLPPLEAMSLGVPTIVSNTTSLPEVCGQAAVQVDPLDSGALAHELQSLLSSPARRSELSEAGRHQAAKFTWSRAAEQTARIYFTLS